jgi:restriction endonuclease S subunit
MGYLEHYEFDGEYITWTTDGANAGTIFYHNEKFNCTNVCGTLKVHNQNILTKLDKLK